MKIAIIGANGQLGSDIVLALNRRDHEILELTHDRVEIADDHSVAEVLKDRSLDMVINTAAMHHVEKCEDSPLEAFRVNAVGIMNLVRFCRAEGPVLMHISTDYVFDGNKAEPYDEDDKPRPLNVYGNSKLAGEYIIQSYLDHYYVLRVSGIYGHVLCRAKGSHFVQTMLRLAAEREEIRVVDDEFLSPTYTVDISEQIAEMVENGAEYGLYHVTAEGGCSWFEFARAIFSLSDVSITLNPARPGEFSGTVQRPKYSVLENRRLSSQGLNRMPHWKDGLTRYLAK